MNDQINSQERQQYGIFFTQKPVVAEILKKINIHDVQNIIDSAAGSCNFLIDLAEQYPEKKFYAIEKNLKVYRATTKIISRYKNIFYYHGDVLFEKFPIPPCDLYIGNPPFINYANLSDTYREAVRQLWPYYFRIEKGFTMMLGSSRGDIAQLIFYYTVRHYLKNNGKFAVILPSSLIRGNKASSGFRDFENVNVQEIVELNSDNSFEYTKRKSIYIIGKKGGGTLFPIPYQADGKTTQLYKSGDSLISLNINLPENSWYSARQGINTLGANNIFIFKKEKPFESSLIFPLFKSSDIHRFKAIPTYSVFLPYKNGKIIQESEMKVLYPAEYLYLCKHKEKLQNRKSRFIKQNWYALFGIGSYTFSKYKVVWKALGARRMEAAVCSYGIPNQSMHCYISLEDRSEAGFICGIMNSDFYTEILVDLNEPGAKSFAQPSSIKKIFIPRYSAENIMHKKISDLALQPEISTNHEGLKQLDLLVRQLYDQIRIENPQNSLF